MVTILFVLGHACSGKTYLAKQWIQHSLNKGEPWCLMDKDTIGETFSKALLTAYGLSINDRDSPEYKKYVRDLEYQACLDVIREQVSLGVNVVVPGPWTKELKNGDLFINEKLDIPENVRLKHVYLDIKSEIIKERLIKRNHRRDEWKMNNWDIFAKTLEMPKIVLEKNLLIFNNEDTKDQLKVLDSYLYNI